MASSPSSSSSTFDFDLSNVFDYVLHSERFIGPPNPDPDQRDPHIRLPHRRLESWGTHAEARRSLFGCCARDRSSVVVVSGGHDEKKEALRSALAYDAESDEWNWLPEMREAKDECGLVCIRGKIWAVGGYGTEGQGRFARSGEDFDFEGDQK